MLILNVLNLQPSSHNNLRFMFANNSLENKVALGPVHVLFRRFNSPKV